MSSAAMADDDGNASTRCSTYGNLGVGKGRGTTMSDILLLKKLREATEASFSDCKNALA